jgi:hypothetical protein
MAQFHYCGTWGDSVDVVKAILAHDEIGIVCIPRILDTADVKPYREWSAELEANLRKYPQTSLTGPFTHSPLGIEEFDDEAHKGRYYLDPSHGGPVLGLTIAPHFQKGSIADLGPGELWYQPRYLDKKSGDWKPPSSELKNAYKALVGVMKSRLTSHRLPDGAAIDIGPEALELFGSGKAAIRWKGKDYQATIQ